MDSTFISMEGVSDRLGGINPRPLGDLADNAAIDVGAPRPPILLLATAEAPPRDTSPEVSEGGG